jgi:hypothetical protein
MAVAAAHYQDDWDVTDTSAGNPYDLMLTRGDEIRYVEVKGTASLGEHVNLTANEVQHARDHLGDVALFIVHGITVDRRDPAHPLASRGTEFIIDPFDVDAGDLRPTAFTWSSRPRRARGLS